MEKILNQQYKDIIKSIFEQYFKPLHYKKENGNFRFVQEDGLGKIVNFRRSWCNDETACSFCVSIGIYFEEGKTISNSKFKVEKCRISPSFEKWWEITLATDVTKLLYDVGKEIEENIFPFLNRIDTKDKAINDVLYGDYGVDYDTAELLIKMGYGKEIFSKLLERPVCYEKLLHMLEEKMLIPIFEDKQIYRVYLVLKKMRYNKKELYAFAKIRGISLKKADEELEKGDRLLAEGEAMYVKKLSMELKGYCVNYMIEPEIRY